MPNYFQITINKLFNLRLKSIVSIQVILFLFQCSGFAQITGTVFSKEDNSPIPGASILIKNTITGTITDFDGNFSLKLRTNQDTIVISSLGFLKKELLVTNGDNIQILLENESIRMDDIVVTALGIKRQKREIGYSTEEVKADIIQRSTAANLVSAINGRASGIRVSEGNGVEGGSTRITIRGNNNITGNNQPLIVIDGVQMENIAGLENIGRGKDWGSAINNINPEDIASFNILKGGAASALYGSRGANGVIEITTKKGKKRKGIGISYNFSYKITHPYKFRNVQNKYGAGGPISFTPPTFPVNEDGVELYPGIYSTNNLIINENGDESSSSAEFGYYGGGVSWGPKMDGREVLWWDGEMRSYSPQPDNISMFYKDGISTIHNISASGGNEKGTVRLSVTRKDQTPVVENSYFNQTTLNLGTNINVSKKVTLDISVSYMDYHRKNSPILGEDPNSFSKGILYSWPRSYQGIDMQYYELPDGSRNPFESYPFQYVSNDLWWKNYNNNTYLDRNKLIGSVSLSYKITDWLDFVVKTGMDFNLDKFETLNKPTDLLGLENGYYGTSMIKNISENHDFLFTIKKENIFDSDINFDASFGGARWEQNYFLLGGNSGLWYYPNMYSLMNYTPYQVEDNSVIQTGDYSKINTDVYTRRTNSVYSFLNFSYKNYAFLHLTGRNDWSSTLPKESNSYFYPSASLSFILTEAFSIKNDWLSFWKIRAGAAQTATDGNPYQTEFYYETHMFDGEQSSSFPDTIPPIELKPQRVNSYEAGTTIGLFDNKIDLDITYYYMHSFDQIIDLPIPTSSGAKFLTINEGILSNRGIEIILNTTILQKRNWTIQSSINYTWNRNIVKSLGDYANEYLLADIWGLNGPAMILTEGDDFGTISGYDYVYHENGQAILNDEGTKYLVTETRVPIGNASPKFLAGWNTSIRFKNFSLNFLIDTKWGGDIYCGSYVIGLQTGQSPETLLERDGGGLPYTDPDGNTSNIGVILPGVYEDGTPNDKVVHYYYKYMPNAGGWGHFLSTPGIVENTWVKMREISFSYKFPKNINIVSNVFQDITISIVGRNLFYIYTTLPDNINPEGIMGSGNAQGFEWSSFPAAQSYIFKLNANF